MRKSFRTNCCCAPASSASSRAAFIRFCRSACARLRKVEQIVREEMDRAGALEVLMPALQPPEIWEQSGRYETAQRCACSRCKDSANREWVLSPTAEEVITTLAADEINSYRQLPKNFYQISLKFRDEIRPRFGLMRAKEFIMKDAYSASTLTDEGGDGELQENV